MCENNPRVREGPVIHYVLVLEKSQARKSALIQNIKSYTAQTIQSISLFLVTKFFKTDTAQSFRVKSSLPSYEAFNKRYDEPLVGEVEHKFVDTRGLYNHEYKDNVNALAVIEKIVATRSFSFVLIVVNPHDILSAKLLLALQYYANILGYLQGKIAFVFTHVDYLHSRLYTDKNLALK
ncbi:hypothetical protein BGZ92_002597 [Podila epicladia]|nr:hypothetical protein BGZ92_002597 [Podila epicladia]